jgi:hypothetical protein
MQKYFCIYCQPLCRERGHVHSLCIAHMVMWVRRNDPKRINSPKEMMNSPKP